MLLNLATQINFTYYYILFYDFLSYGYIIMITVDSCMIWFHFDCIMQLKKSFYITADVGNKKSATTFGNFPDWWGSVLPGNRRRLDLSIRDAYKMYVLHIYVWHIVLTYSSSVPWSVRSFLFYTVDISWVQLLSHDTVWRFINYNMPRNDCSWESLTHFTGLLKLCSRLLQSTIYALQWRHNGWERVSNHQPYDYLHNRLFGCR